MWSWEGTVTPGCLEESTRCLEQHWFMKQWGVLASCSKKVQLLKWVKRIITDSAISFSASLSNRGVGWRPRRTVIFASWDAEEFGLLGSTEWAEVAQKQSWIQAYWHVDALTELHQSQQDNARLLQERAVAYINADSGIEGEQKRSWLCSLSQK